PRWLTHRNGARGLPSVVIAVADVDEAAARFARFTGRPAMTTRSGQTIELDRGRVELVTRDAFEVALPEIAIATLPFIGAYAVHVGSLGLVERILRDAGLSRRAAGDCLVAPFPAELGAGGWLFVDSRGVSLFAEPGGIATPSCAASACLTPHASRGWPDNAGDDMATASIATSIKYPAVGVPLLPALRTYQR